MNYQVRAGSLVGFDDLVRKLGGNPAALMRALDLDIAVLRCPDLYIPYTAVALLLNEAAEKTNSPDFGIQLGTWQGLKAMGSLGRALEFQPNAAEALRLAKRHLDFHARGAHINIVMELERVVGLFKLDFADQVDCTQLTAMSVGLIVRAIEEIVGPGYPPIQVDFSSHATGSLETYQKLLGCPVRFDAGRDSITCPRSVLALPVAEQRQEQWSDHSQATDLVRQVDEAITALLPTGKCNLPLVAAVTGMQPRVLQKRLKQDGLTFGEIQKRVRLRLAQHYLAHDNVSLTDLALNLGYAELAVFSRAFREWTGQTPHAWREAAQHG